MFALAIALGCDFFDSAAYAIFARGDRYMTEHGTRRLDELRYFPCSCPVCEKSDPRSVVVLPKAERQKMLALHNLYVSFSELKRVKQTIIEGRLWEHLELRAHGHPALLQALKGLKRHIEVLEKHSPVTKKSGLFFFSSLGLVRPEVARHRKRLIERYCPPKAKVLLLLPQTKVKTLHKSNKLESTLNNIRRETGNKTDFHICVYMAPFGFTPIELNEIYPLSQYEIAVPPDQETIEYAAKQIADYIMTADYRGVVLVKNDEVWKGKIVAICRQICKRKEIPLTILEARATKSC
jgi:7-cyano-7-deazaguanine tRNA-ribosyltransferase